MSDRWRHPRTWGNNRKKPELALADVRHHPRTRGSNILMLQWVHISQASPPNSGKRQSREETLCDPDGITPVHGEITLVLVQSRITGWHHPRIWGRDECRPLSVRYSQASPRMWGNNRLCVCCKSLAMASPLYTEKQRFENAKQLISVWHHPRTRGNNTEKQ